MSDYEDAVNANDATAPVGEEQSQGENTQVATETQPTDQEINWRRANETMKTQSDEIRQLKQQLYQMQQKPEDPKSKYGGKDADDLTTFEDVDKYFLSKSREIEQKFAELEVKSRYSDYDSVIAKYGAQLPESVKYGILNAKNPHMAAYEACQMLAEKDKLLNTVSDSAKRVKDNLGKVGSASSVGNSGTLSEAKRFENMSIEDVLAHSNKILGR